MSGRKLGERKSGKDHPRYGKHHSAESRRKMSESQHNRKNPHRGHPFSEESRKKISDTITGKYAGYLCGDRNPNWKGGISFEPYCVKFNTEFKNRVRAFFDHKCVECGKTKEENGQNLSVHHANYDKMICCNDVKPLFVALCRKHHGVVNYNREYWEHHFTQIVNEKYDGQCYLPKCLPPCNSHGVDQPIAQMGDLNARKGVPIVC